MISIREAFGQTLVNLGEQDKEIALVSCDLKVATKSDYFFQKFPERSVEVGIAEANAVGIAAGLSMSGYKIVLSSFGAFLTGKNVEIRTSIAYNNAPVTLVGTHGGLIGPDGATQSGIQDIAVMRSMPRMKVFQPSSPIMTKNIVEHCINSSSPTYIRVARNEVPEIYPANQNFIEGEPYLHGKISENVLISSGPMLHNCISAAEKISDNYNIDISVIDIPSLKPLNLESLEKMLSSCKKLFTVEDHMIDGGLGSLIAESLTLMNIAPSLHIKGLNSFVGSGKPDELEKRYMLDEESIIDFLVNKIK
jgi:transketolase